MLTALASGAVPDLYMTQANDFPRWASLGALQPIDAFVQKDGMDLDKVFFKSSIEGSKWDGKLIQFPFKVPTSLMIWYNKKLFQQAGLDPNNPPKTWEQLEDAAAQDDDRGRKRHKAARHQYLPELQYGRGVREYVHRVVVAQQR